MGPEKLVSKVRFWTIFWLGIAFSFCHMSSVQNNYNPSNCRHLAGKALTVEQPEQARHYGALQQSFIVYRFV